MAEKSMKEKIDKEFYDLCRKIAVENTKVSGFMPSVRRITKAFRKHSLTQEIAQEIANTKLEDDRWK